MTKTKPNVCSKTVEKILFFVQQQNTEKFVLLRNSGSKLAINAYAEFQKDFIDFKQFHRQFLNRKLTTFRLMLSRFLKLCSYMLLLRSI